MLNHNKKPYQIEILYAELSEMPGWCLVHVYERLADKTVKRISSFNRFSSRYIEDNYHV